MPDAFEQITKTGRHRKSHGEETAAINQLRIVFGLERMKGGARQWRSGSSCAAARSRMGVSSVALRASPAAAAGVEMPAPPPAYGCIDFSKVVSADL